MPQSRTNLIPSQVGQLIKPLPVPNGFSWTNHPLAGRMWKDGDGKYHTDYDVSTLQVTGQTYYVSQAASAGNDGLTPVTPLPKISDAYNKPDVSVIVLCGPGTQFYYNYGMNGTAIDKNITIKTLYGTRVAISNQSSASWTKTVGYTNVYQITRQYASTVIDFNRKNANGDFLKLTSVASIAACDSMTDSYFIDSGTNTVYVNVGGGTPNWSVWPLVNNVNALTVNFSTEKTLYLENIDIIGGISISGSNVGSIYAKNCTFQYGQMNDSFNASNINQSILQNCVASQANGDGFSYTAVKAVEINNTGRYNGKSGDTTDNGSTSHGASNIIRINGTYNNSYGPNVADVQGAQSWNLGCTAHDSLTGTSTQNCDFQVQDSGTKMFLDGCTGYNSTYSIRASNTAQIYTRNGSVSSYSTADTATISEY